MRSRAATALFCAALAGNSAFASNAAQAQEANLPDELERQATTFDPNMAPPDGDRVTTEDPENSSTDLLIAPIPVSNPALGTGGALAAVLYYNPNDASEPWVTGVGAGYTSSDTWGGGLFHRMSLGGDRFKIAALAGYGDARLKYYGIGSQAGQAGISVALRQRGLTGYLDGQVRIFDHGLLSNLHVGARISYLRVRSSISIPTPNRPDLDLPAIERRSAIATIGPSFTFDTRDHPFTPRKGVLVTGTMLFGADFLGSDFEHRKLELLSTGYFPIGKSTTLAIRKTLCTVKGDAPFYDLCNFGQHADLRGYEAGRYRDRASWALQAELRQPLFGDFGVVGFAGFGGIAPSGDAIWKDSDVLASGGFGLRYRASKQNNVNLRVDVAWGKDGSAIYFGVGEAF